MPLDQTRIVIRERGFGEVLGLAMQVIRAHPGGLLLAMVVGLLPFALLNGWLLAGILEEEIWIDTPTGYWFALTCLMVVEAPLATAPITLYLGRMTFAGGVGIRSIAIDFIRSLPQMLWIQGLLRTLLLPVLLLPYLTWPYMGELVLLERNPLLAGKKRQLTTLRRSRNLHAGSGGELFGRWLLAILAGGVMWIALAAGTLVMVVQLSGWEPTPFARHWVVYPATLWIVVGWMAVVRFLSYLDLRIRREGWDVELSMRAEAKRLERTATSRIG